MTKIDDLTEAVTNLVDHIETQNELIRSYPTLSFRVNIMWRVFCVVCGISLAGALGLIGKVMIDALSK